jgi:hypothetical protein
MKFSFKFDVKKEKDDSTPIIVYTLNNKGKPIDGFYMQ